ncbi:hypothetical protein HK102_003772 [Quaeritorhiza haematococci]|nr:hypothetical protein HK102_003772 [Quaeritorhiza haematococci]
MFAKKYLSQNRVVFPVGLKYDEKKSRDRGYSCKILDPPPPQGWQQLTMDSVPRGFRLNSLGLVLGPVSGVLAVDIDNMDLWKVVLDTLGETEPLTCWSISQRGAVHLLFKVTPALEAVCRKGVFGLKPLGYNDFDILGQGDFLLVPPSSFETPERYSLLDNPDKLMEAPDWLIEVLTRGSAAYHRVRGSYIKQAMAEKPVDTGVEKVVLEHADSSGFTAAEEALVALDTEDRLKEVEKHVKKLCAKRAIDRQSWIEVGMAIHHATDGHGMELWDTFSWRAGPYDRRHLEYQWDSFKNGKVAKTLEEKTKADDNLRREAVKFGVDHTGGKGVFESWDDPKNLVAVIKNTMHHPDHRVECVFSSEGAFQRCLECGWRNPFAGELVISQTKYPVLHQQFINITINNTVNNVNVNIESVDIGWNQFREDGVGVVDDEEINKLLLEALSGTHQRMAKLATHFAFARTWWYFKKSDKGGGVWVTEKEDMTVKMALVDDDFLALFVKAKAAFEDTSVEVKNRKRKVDRIQYVINQLEMQSYKASVVKELAGIVSKRSENNGFLKKLGMNCNLIGFDNGVYDLQANEFRVARPDNFLTKTVGYDFDPERHPVIEGAVHAFFDQVFPDPEVKTYMLKFLASCLAGHTSDQLFHFGHGDRSNGKGILSNLMGLTLGEYAAPMNALFLTSKIKDANAPTPTLTRLVGCRFVYISEVIEGSSINEQTFKQMTGEDRLPYCPLHGEQVDFHPDFKLFMVCDSLPK